VHAAPAVQELQARRAEENVTPNRGRAPYASSMPSRSIILPIFRKDLAPTTLDEQLMANSLFSRLNLKTPCRVGSRLDLRQIAESRPDFAFSLAMRRARGG
jgi:hypothetical protein